MVRRGQHKKSIGQEVGKLDKGGNRIGTISSFDKKTGMASVLYSDRDGDVTQMLPFATFNGEYKIPETGSKVLVVHLSNGSEMGIILGTYWNEGNPAEGHSTYHKHLGDGASFDYDAGTGVLNISAKHLEFISADDNGSFTAEGLMADIRAIKKKLDMA